MYILHLALKTVHSGNSSIITICESIYESNRRIGYTYRKFAVSAVARNSLRYSILKSCFHVKLLHAIFSARRRQNKCMQQIAHETTVLCKNANECGLYIRPKASLGEDLPARSKVACRRFLAIKWLNTANKSVSLINKKEQIGRKKAVNRDPLNTNPNSFWFARPDEQAGGFVGKSVNVGG